MRSNYIRRTAIFNVLLSVIFVGNLFADAHIASATVAQSHARTQPQRVKPRMQTARVLINEQGYSRNSITLRRGVPTRITFVRQTDNTCATEVVIPAYGIRKSLPLKRPVVVSFTPRNTGEFAFTCGMNMMRGKMIVR